MNVLFGAVILLIVQTVLVVLARNLNKSNQLYLLKMVIVTIGFLIVASQSANLITFVQSYHLKSDMIVLLFYYGLSSLEILFLFWLMIKSIIKLE